MRSLFLILLTTIIVTACNNKSATVSGGAINADAPFLWETAFPKDMYISSDYSDANEQNKINETMGAWETALNNTNFFTTAGFEPEKTTGLASTSQLRDNKFVIYKATQWPYPDYPDALAITQIFAIRYNVGDSDEYVAIQEADVIVNYENFDFYLDAQGGFEYDFRTVLLHELGHFLGLQHKPRTYNRNNTVMYPSIFTSETKRTPKTVDIQDISSKYHIVLPLTAGGSAIAGTPKKYTKKAGDPGQMTKVILELKANGECVHHENGAVIKRHSVNLN